MEYYGIIGLQLARESFMCNKFFAKNEKKHLTKPTASAIIKRQGKDKKTSTKNKKS